MDYYSNPKQNQEVKENNYSASTPISFYERPIQSSNNTENNKEEKVSTTPVETEQSWKPMDFYSKPTTENKVEETPTAPIQVEASNTEKPKVEEPKVEEVKPAENTVEATKVVESNSNVTSFINTWKNWLKIDRTPKVELSKQDKKSAIIDKFIENNPKISPIKEDIDFVVKERGDDISHLMTETLAQLYLEQKLYTKAMNAYKILQEKYPERKEEFGDKINEIKQMRHGK